MHRLAQSVAAYIRKNELLRPGHRVGIAVSSGADSIALLRLMLELRDELGVVLSVVHLNHKLRGAESDADEQFVSDLTETYRLEFISEKRDVKVRAVEKKLSLEAAAREVRYEFFRDALQSRLDRIATAHTLDDQAETVLLKLARGAGTRGLAGIYPKVQVGNAALNQPAIVRPLLRTRGAELRSYIAEIGQIWREDVSNQDLRHTRNRVRRDILPRLKQDVNPGVCEVLAEVAEISRAEEEYWFKEVAGLLPQVWTAQEAGGILNLSQFDLFPLALRRRLLRAVAESLGIGLEFRQVEEILAIQSDRGTATLPGQWTVSRRGEDLRFQKGEQPFSDYQYALSVPGKVVVAEAGIELDVFVVNGTAPDCQQQLVDLRFGQEPWVVRNWRAGERFWPAHTKMPKKIKELLQDRHILGREKQYWPVIACGDQIIWLRGFGIQRDSHASGEKGVLIRELPQRFT